MTAIHDYCYHDDDPECENKSTRVEVLRGLISVECMAISFMWLKYYKCVKDFKKVSRLPDIFREEFVREIANPDQAFSKVDERGEIQYHAVIERQSELLHYICNIVRRRQEEVERSRRMSGQRSREPYEEA